MKIKKIILCIICLILCIGCQKENGATKFKKEYEQYNDTNIKLDIDENNIIKYATSDEINKITKEKSAVIFIGKPQDDLSRTAINILLKAADSTDLKEIYYIDSLDNLIQIQKIDSVKTPIVINVLEGEIVSYHIGTINNEKELTEDAEQELYNIYLDGIHEVLQDACDEKC